MRSNPYHRPPIVAVAPAECVDQQLNQFVVHADEPTTAQKSGRGNRTDYGQLAGAAQRPCSKPAESLSGVAALFGRIAVQVLRLQRDHELFERPAFSMTNVECGRDAVAWGRSRRGPR